MSDANVSPQDDGAADKQSMSIQEKVEYFFHSVFGKWGLIISNHTCKVFWLSILFFVALSGGMAMRKTFENEQLVWTPADNNSLKSSNKGSAMFPSKGGFVSMIAEVKDPSNDDASVINLDILEEVKKFSNQMQESETEINGTNVKWTDVCSKAGDECRSEESILRWGYEQTPQPAGPPKKEWKLKNLFASDAELLSAIQGGKKDNKVIQLSSIIGGTTPETINQDNEQGTNDIKTAKAMMLGYPYLLGDYTKEELQQLEEVMEKKAVEFSKNSKLVNIYLFTNYGLRQAFSGDMQDDLALVQISVSLVAVYCIIFMGSCSPIHFRSAAAGITLLCVGLSYGASNGLAYLVGGKTAGIHNLLPFLLIGIGVDDMFVISSNIDQTDPRLPVEKRMMIGLQHAGSSITITSFTNAIAFFLGCTSSLDALSSFCFFAGLGVLMLYLTSISVFAAFMVWDIRRQMQQKGDCCGACMCKETTFLCCGGCLLTKSQKSYPFQGEEGDEVPDEKYANGTQKFLHEKLSYWTTSKVGVIVILTIWVIYTGVSIYGVSQVKIDFKSSYFISSTAYVRDYFNLQEEYFKSGETVTFYTDAEKLDITTYDSQEKMIEFSKNLKNCKDCAQQFTVPDSFKSWYLDLHDFSEKASGTPGTKCTGSFDADKNALKPDKFIDCLTFYLSADGARYAGDVNFSEDKTVVESFRQSIKLIYIDNSAQEGPQVLTDMEKLSKASELGDTFSFNQRYFDFEVYVVFQQEAVMNIVLALVAVFIVLMIVTANFTVTMFILLCVALVDLFLLGLLTFWDITLNSVTVVNNVIAIGLAVDYSAHIGHAFLLCEAPEKDENGNELTNHQKRVFKARGALGSMGSSVFHGAFSTFLAIIVLSPSKSYIFTSFFRMWFGIIVFGVSNGFILLPVLLSLCGPLNTAKKTKKGAENADIEMKVDQQMMEGGNGTRVNQVQDQVQVQQLAVESLESFD